MPLPRSCPAKDVYCLAGVPRSRSAADRLHSLSDRPTLLPPRPLTITCPPHFNATPRRVTATRAGSRRSSSTTAKLFATSSQTLPTLCARAPSASLSGPRSHSSGGGGMSRYVHSPPAVCVHGHPDAPWLHCRRRPAHSPPCSPGALYTAISHTVSLSAAV